MRKRLLSAVVAVAAVTLAGCTESGHSKAENAGIPISYRDYYKMCDVHSGEWVRDMNIERRWTQAQHRELWDIVEADPSCQPDE